MKNPITAHMLVKNEDQFIWYAIASILPYVDRLIIFDTGSTDQTIPIIKLFNDNKIIFQEKKIENAEQLVKLRQKQIAMTKTDWIWIVDGDEIYPNKTVEAVLDIVSGKKHHNGIIIHRFDLLGDIYHFQDEKVGTYDQFGKKGHYVLRLINRKKIDGLKWLGIYPNEYLADRNNRSIKERGEENFAFVEERIFHAMYLKRSSSGGNLWMVLNRKKRKIEFGKEISKNELPEVFLQERTGIVPDITKKTNFSYKLFATFTTPLKKIKRKFI